MVEGWEGGAVVWLLDTGASHYRQDVILRAQPVVSARPVVQQLATGFEATHRAWVPLESWERAGLPTDAHEPVLTMLRRVGPVLVARLHSAELICDALTGRRWVPRL